MKKIKKTLDMILCNFDTLVRFELFYKIITILIFSPLFVNAFNLVMKITGYRYLTFENVIGFLLNPITVCMLLILILLLLLYTVFDITAIVIILDKSYHHEKIRAQEAAALALSKVKKLFHIRNIPLALFVLVMIPFLNFGLASGYISSLSIPEFISDYISANKTLSFVYSALVMVLFVFLVRWIYSLHYMILENKTFKEARRSSINLIRNSYVKDVIAFVILPLICTALYVILLFAGILLIYFISGILKNHVLLESLTTTIVWIFLALSAIAFTLLSTPISYAVISVSFYNHKAEQGEEIIPVNVSHQGREIKIAEKYRKYLRIALGVLALVFGTIFTYGIYRGDYNLNIEYARTMEITAHRGASVDYPENTMEAFIGAKELGADWIELDVQQTKDERLIVLHDTNLKRTTGANKNTWEVTYDEIKDLDAGSFLDSKFSDSRIPLLEDVVKWAKENNMKLNIELKPTGYETDFEAEVIEIINEYDFAKDCVITSQVYEVLENVKEVDENIETVYVMSLAYGNITSLDQADHFSIEATSITKKLVSKIHNEGKEVYAWTINTSENIEKMIDLNVDNIITDNITTAKNIVYESKSSNLVNEFVKVLENLLG